MTQFPPGVFLIFAMENHILWTYLGIKLIEIDPNGTCQQVVAHSLAGNTTIIGQLDLPGNKSCGESKKRLSEHFPFFSKWLTSLILKYGVHFHLRRGIS